uniref:G_PROTEIN_RECEP_F1_2 domain-containing protein n=2 Tax=Schistosoma mansoni TaxID=6183 RepID=A0A5K4F4L1_SCHMA
MNSSNNSLTSNFDGTRHNDCLEYELPNLFVAIFGFFTIIFGSAGSILTYIYLFMFRRSSKSVSVTTTATRTERTSNNSCSSAGGSDIQPKQSNLRESTQLLMACLALVDFLGQNISCLRYTILALKQYDIRLFYTDIFCRLQLFAEYCCQDSSAWFMCAMTGERFWLLVKPTSSYSMNKKQIKPAALVLLICILVIIGKNSVLLAGSQDVCGEGYTDKTFFLVDLIFKCLIPFILLMTTSIGNLVLMHRQLVKMHADHMTINKGLSIITMSRKEKQKLPPTTAAMWEVIFACRMMIVSSIVYIIGALPINLFKLSMSNFKNVLTARDICSVTDIIYNAINIMFWTCVGLRFYLYIFSSPRVRRDMFLIFRIILVKFHCLSPIRRKSKRNETSQSKSGISEMSKSQTTGRHN